MEKLALPPDKGGYSFLFTQDIFSVDYGGRSLSRAGLIDSPIRIKVRWSLSFANYMTLITFFRDTLVNGSLPFLIDLLVERNALREFEAYIVATTFKLDGKSGHTYNVSAELDIMPS